MEAFNWEQHKDIMQDIITLLEFNNLIPSQLNIKPDGWTEAVFILQQYDDTTREIWHQLEQAKKVELEAPILEMDNGQFKMLRVKFRVKPQPISTWERIRQLVS